MELTAVGLVGEFKQDWDLEDGCEHYRLVCIDSDLAITRKITSVNEHSGALGGEQGN
jgi:hypothetical protein